MTRWMIIYWGVKIVVRRGYGGSDAPVVRCFGVSPLRRTAGQAAGSAISVSDRYPNSYSEGVK
jgi:hypothetical protein